MTALRQIRVSLGDAISDAVEVRMASPKVPTTPEREIVEEKLREILNEKYNA